MAFTLTLSLGDAGRILASIQAQLTDLTPAMEQARDILLASVEQNFEQGGRPAWAPLRLPRVGTPLAGSGRLRGSITSEVTPTSVRLSSALPYSGIQQYGGTVNVPEFRPRTRRALRWVNAEGATVFARRVRAHTVVIPPRPYLVARDEDCEAIVAAVEAHVLKGVA